MSTIQRRMAELYSMTTLRDTSQHSIKPSSLASGLGEKSADLSTSLMPTMGELLPASTKTVGGPNGDPGPEAKKRVVVVGAGISGLRAAAVLQKHGVDVVVVEGRDRIGGRIHTTHSEKGPRDIGMWESTSCG
jgi:polyamine oxidase